MTAAEDETAGAIKRPDPNGDLHTRLRAGGGRAPQRLQIRLVNSIEPGVVFDSLRAQCVPSLCDECAIDLGDGSGGDPEGHGTAHPSVSTAGVLGPVPASNTCADRLVVVPFACPESADAPISGRVRDQLSEGFSGIARFTWHRRAATQVERTMASVLVEHAVTIVTATRAEHIARAATSSAENLRIALQTSREIGAAIGILMHVHKVTNDRAFDMLKAASQRTHRKVRDIAVDVVDTGRLDDWRP